MRAVDWRLLDQAVVRPQVIQGPGYTPGPFFLPGRSPKEHQGGSRMTDDGGGLGGHPALARPL